MVLDKRNGVLGLFQLKWQDPFGSSMRERESKERNFVAPTNRWIDIVHSRDSEGGAAQLALRFGFPKRLAASVKDVLLFVIGRYFSCFSDGTVRDRRAAWGHLEAGLQACDGSGRFG